MTIYTTLMKDEDLHTVLDALWERGQKELEHFEFKQKEYGLLIDYVLGCSTESYTLRSTENDKPLAVFGGMPLENNGLATFFFATDNLLQKGREVTLFMRDFTADWKKNNPNTRLEIWSVSTHPHAPRWFKTLGFDPISAEGMLHKYLYVGKKLTPKP